MFVAVVEQNVVLTLKLNVNSVMAERGYDEIWATFYASLKRTRNVVTEIILIQPSFQLFKFCYILHNLFFFFSLTHIVYKRD